MLIGFRKDELKKLIRNTVKSIKDGLEENLTMHKLGLIEQL